MDAPQALALLGLTEGATAADIARAVAAKRTQIQQKHDAAPTDALKAKFAQLLAQVDEAGALLSSTAAPASKNPSPLSQTKLADLPGMGPDASESLIIEPGTELAGRYQVGALLGSGGMGAVYQAFDTNTRKPVALKLLLPGLTRNPQALERFLDEARLSQQLSHPGIVNVYDIQKDGDTWFIVMELLEGQDLRQMMNNRALVRQVFSQAELLDVAKQLCAALRYAHQYTVHRDIKPENIWLTEEGEYKLMDFGIARVQSTSQRTQTGAAMGTAYYMAPEQIRGAKNLDGRADLYAIGVLLYEMAAGEVPAGVIKPLRERCPHVSKSFSNAVMQCLQSNPDERFANADALLAALEEKGSNSIPAGAWNKGGDSLPAVSWEKVAIAAGVLVATLVFGVMGFAIYSYDADKAATDAEESAAVEAARKNPTGVLVKVPAGSFVMGDLTGSDESNEKPSHRVNINAFWMQEHEVTWAQYQLCIEANRCSAIRDGDNGWGKGNRPVIKVSARDIRSYISWLSMVSKKRFRLPTEAEWEYAARAGSRLNYTWGSTINCDQARYGYRSGGECGDEPEGTLPVKSFAPNAYGLYDMHGNVWEYTQDSWHDSYIGAPIDGSAWITKSNFSLYVVRGGSWDAKPSDLRSAKRETFGDMGRTNLGFRLVHD
ncbi:bifunctional serine/threonine-protein kinase/formylglycine-generating enzyme family protein [Simiduia aestuariiviva]|uniref:Formylglycine-generating enzyme required for sulfatase activity n=1 Tax=Simiduia aestuariiviva TaxID=1510459 RepID=A0A839URM6_9GAMM|nr:bifunctional serine/threonine-protein kinase/formylglycine-generating enzyme family protein [Simiduia aestuariiviva]MBB3168035.1 formylglycine-generating enzyme required for sulfatase activity [Simiduia aestuariiviva]